MSRTDKGEGAARPVGIARSPQTGETGETALGRLAGACYDRRRTVLVLWILAIIGVTVVAQMVGTHFENKFTAGNTPSQRATDILQATFPSRSGDSADIVFKTTGPVTGQANEKAIDAVVARVQPLPWVQSVTSPFSAAGAHQIAQPSKGNIAFAQVQFTTDTADIPVPAIKKVITTAQAAAHQGFEVQLGGAPISAAATAAPGPSEGIGITAAILIMLLAFGSVVAMGLPVLTALAGLGIGVGLLELLTHVLTVPNFSPEMAAMIGIGVGIDYALFIVTRYRQGIFEGRDPRNAVVTSLMTSGRSVLFAGSTVVISLFGLFLIGQAYMIGLATACIAAVLMVLIAALTLLPAMLGFAGNAIDKLHVPRLLQTGGPPPPWIPAIVATFGLARL
jgi:RND superfamily putative drug exporter